MLGHHLAASETQFQWRFAGGPMMVQLKRYLDPLSPSTKKKKKKKKKKKGYQIWTPSDKTYWIRVWSHDQCLQEYKAWNLMCCQQHALALILHFRIWKSTKAFLNYLYNSERLLDTCLWTFWQYWVVMKRNALCKRRTWSVSRKMA